MHGLRTDVHGHWPVRATDSTDISLCVPRTHGRATDMPRTFPVAQKISAVHACGLRGRGAGWMLKLNVDVGCGRNWKLLPGRD